MLTIFTAIKIIAAASYLGLALLTLRSAADRRVRIFFSIYLFGMLSWQLGSVVVSFTTDRADALVAYNLMVACSGTYTILFFAFTRALLGISGQRVLAALSYAVCVVQIVTAVAGLQFKSVEFGKGGYWVPVYSEPLMYALSLLSFAFWGLGLANLFRGFFRERSPVHRNRIVYILIGASVTIVGASTNLIGLRDYPVDISANLASALIIGYAVVRHRLMAIRLIVARSLFYSLLTAFLIVTYVGVVVALEHTIQSSVGYSGELFGAVAVFILALLFLPIRNALQSLIDRIFFREKGDYQRATQNFSRRIAALYEEEDILSLVARTIEGAVRPTVVAICLHSGHEDAYVLRRAEGKGAEALAGMAEGALSHLSRWLREEGKPLVREESLLDPDTRPLVEGARIFGFKEASVVVPILLEQRMFGVIVLGQKQSGTMYGEEDLSFLSTIANQAAAAFDKSEIFLKIRRRLSEQTLLFVLSEKFRGSVDFETVMKSVVQVLRSFLSCEHCAVVLFDKGRKAVPFSQDRLSDIAARLAIEAIEDTVSGSEDDDRDGLAMLAKIRSLASSRPDLRREEREAVGALAFRPLLDGGVLLGYLALSDRTIRGADAEEENELLRTVQAILSQGIVLHRTLGDLLTLESYNEKILDSLNDMGDTLVIINERGAITKVNKAACRVLEYREEELLGRHVSEIVADDGGVLSPSGLAELRRNRPVSNRELAYKSRTGNQVPMLFSGSALVLENGRGRDIIGIARDMTEHRKAEEAQKNLLLVQEIHHRIKNNLQVISSLLYLQAGYVEDERVKEMFRESQNRVRSMALIHERLYRSRTPSSMDFSEYVRDLARNLQSSYSLKPNRVELAFAVSEVSLGMDTAVPCGLIINELVSNAFKYAFPGERNGRIEVSLRALDPPAGEDDAKGAATRPERRYELVVEDDGVGIKIDGSIESYKSLGLRIVSTLTKQLHGSIEVSSEGGTKFRIVFRELR